MREEKRMKVDGERIWTEEEDNNNNNNNNNNLYLLQLGCHPVAVVNTCNT